MGIRDDDLEGGLFEAFRPQDSENGSVLERIEALHGAGSSVLLRESDEDVSPVLIRREDESLPQDDPRYQILGELARGGIGVVYRGRDKDLNRDIALKVLRPEYAERQDVIQRFVEEAQVAGQLQHPGIVPVYGLGLQADGRPSFAMKLIKGRTLAELLDSNPRDLDLIAIFEQIVQTLGYAHSRGVIHRDLKPANVMVGAFGEVQVVDWGFAKILGQEEAKRAPDRTVIATIRSGPVGSQSVAGSVMGTPAYMPPEQALGRIDDLDERTDVFALGAILCEILTGRAPYTGEPKDQLIAAVQCLLEPARESLDAADAPEGLKEIVRDCLRPLSAERPKDAAAVAERLSSYLAGVEASAQQAELDALASEREATREAHARRRTLSIAAIALFALLAGGGGYLAWKSDRDAREATAAPLIADALRQAKRFEGGKQWAAAVGATRKAVDVAASHGVADGGASILLARYESEQEAADFEAALRAADRRLLLELEEARMRGVDHYTGAETDAAFVAAVARRWPDMEVDTERLKASSDAVRYAAAFDAWALLRHRVRNHVEVDWRKVDALARAVHPESNALRDAMLGRDVDGIESHPDLDQVPVPILVNVCHVLLEARRDKAAIALLRRAHRRHPDGFLVNCALANAAARIGDNELAIQHSKAALALRADSIEARHHLGIALAAGGDHDAAVRLWREAAAMEPRWVHGLEHVAGSLAAQGKTDEALAAIEEGVPTSADDARGHLRRAYLYDDMGDGGRTIGALRRAVRIDPKGAGALSFLAGMLANYPKAYKEASERYRAALALRPDHAGDHADLGKVYYQLGRMAEAEASYRAALEHDANEAAGHIGLGYIHLNRGETAAAIKAFQAARALTPRNSADHANLGFGLMKVGLIDEAEAELHRGLRVNPRDARVRLNLGALLLSHRQRPAEALVHLRRGLELDPGMARLHATLGGVLDALGDDDKAVAAYRQAIKLEPTDAGFHTNLGVLLLDRGDVDEAIRVHEEAVRLDPTDRIYWWNLGQAYRTKGDVENTIRAFRRMVACDPDHAQSNYQLATYLLRQTGDPRAALPLLEKTLQLDPAYAEAWCNRASCLLSAGRIEEALASMRRGHALGSKRPDWTYESADWLKGYELMAATAKRLPAVLAGTLEPRSPREALVLANVALARGHYAGSVELYRRAFGAAPTFVQNPRTRFRFSAACAAVKAGEATHPQALAWLRGDLAQWKALLLRMPAQAARAMVSWQREDDLASVREGKHATADWKAFWAEVASLRKQVREASK